MGTAWDEPACLLKFYTYYALSMCHHLGIEEK